MKEIKTREELREAANQARSVVMFSKADCLHCSIVRTCVESVEKYYPLLGFHFTESRELSNARNIDTYPVLVFYENGIEQGRLIGSNHAHKIKELLNLWILKE